MHTCIHAYMHTCIHARERGAASLAQPGYMPTMPTRAVAGAALSATSANLFQLSQQSDRYTICITIYYGRPGARLRPLRPPAAGLRRRQLASQKNTMMNDGDDDDDVDDDEDEDDADFDDG